MTFLKFACHGISVYNRHTSYADSFAKCKDMFCSWSPWEGFLQVSRNGTSDSWCKKTQMATVLLH